VSSESQNETKPAVSQNVLYGLAMVGGLGLTLMIVAAGIGVLNLEDLDGGLISLFVALGFGLLVASIGGWAIATRPFENFDDITVAQYHGHHHEEHHEEAHAEGQAEAPAAH
jgi:hypothetical protein